MEVRPLGLLAGVLPIAVVVACDPGGWSPFGPAKWLVVSVLVLAAGAVALWPARGTPAALDPPSVSVHRSTVDQRADTEVRVWLDIPIALPWAVLIGVMVVAAAGGLDPLYAWTGTPERHLGVLGWALIGLAFLVGQQLRLAPSEGGDRVTLAGGLVLAGLCTGGYAAIEALWRAPIELDTATQRLGGPFGSPAFLGAACTLLVPACAGIAAEHRTVGRWRVAAAVAATLCAVALIGSGARAGWIGIAVAGVVTVAARRRIGFGRVGGHLAKVAAGVVAVLLGITVALLGGRMDDLLDRSRGAGSRLDEWRVAARVIGERPVFGTGPEGYRLAVPGNIDVQYERTYGRAVVPDRAHSGVLDVTATGGLAAGIAYVVLLALVALRLWRSLGIGDPLVTGLSAGVIGYLAQQQLLFPLAELDPVVWLVAGAVVAPVRSGRGTDSHPQAGAGTPQPESRAGRYGLRAGAVVLGIGSLVAAVAGVADVAADRLDKRALVAINRGEVVGAIDAAQRAVDIRPDVVRYWLVLARAEQSARTLAGVDRALATVDEALNLSPLDPLVRQERGLLLSRRAAITGEPADVGAALGYWRQLVAWDPVNARWQLELGRAAAAAEQPDVARGAWLAAANLAPDDPEPTQLLEALG